MKRFLLLLLSCTAASAGIAVAQTSPWNTEVELQDSTLGAVVTITFPTNEAERRITWAQLAFVAGPDGCDLPPTTDGQPIGEPTTSTGYNSSSVAVFIFPVAPPCNGQYSVTIDATATKPRTADARRGPHPAELLVEIPANPPTEVVAAANNDRSVKVTWTAPYDDEDNPPPPDFLGYEVVRMGADDSEQVVATQVTESTEFTDKALPAAGGTFTYEVVSLRPDANGEPFASDAAASEPVTVQAAPADSTVPSTTPTSGNTGGVIASPPRTRSSGSSTRPALPRPTTTTLPDQGYETELPYEFEPGEEEARPPDEVLDLRERNDDGGTGLVRPVAVSLVLGLWAMHVLYVTRAAQRANQLAPTLVVTPEPPPPPPPPPPSAAPVDDWLHPFDYNDPMKWWSNNP